MPTIYFEGVYKALPKMASGYWLLLLLPSCGSSRRCTLINRRCSAQREEVWS